MSRPLPIVAVQAPPVSATEDLGAFSEQARRFLDAFPQTEFMIFPELHLHAGSDGRPGSPDQLRDQAQPLDGSRRTLRRAMATGGHPVQRSWRRPSTVPRKLVFLVDVSGSMEPYARPMVMFLQAAVRGRRTVEAFSFGTRLTRLTPHLAGRQPDQALQRAARAVPDWAGGTRIGENLRAFNDMWGRRGMTRGSSSSELRW